MATTEKRLAGIEARRMDILAEWDTQLPRDDVTIIVDDDVPWLIARIRELDEQLRRTQHAWRLSDKTFGVEIGALKTRIRFLESQLDMANAAVDEAQVNGYN